MWFEYEAQRDNEWIEEELSGRLYTEIEVLADRQERFHADRLINSSNEHPLFNLESFAEPESKLLMENSLFLLTFTVRRTYAGHIPRTNTGLIDRRRTQPRTVWRTIRRTPGDIPSCEHHIKNKSHTDIECKLESHRSDADLHNCTLWSNART